MSYKQPYIYAVDFLPLTGSTGTNYTDFEFKLLSDTNFEFIKICHIATSNAVNVKLYNSTTGRDVFYSQADLRAISGTAFNGITPNGFRPYILPAPLKASASSEFILSASDKSGSSNNLRIAFHGNHILHGEAPWLDRNKENWEMPLAIGAIPAYGNVTKSIVLERNAGFLVYKLTGIRTSDCVVSIVSNGNAWMSRETHFDNLFGNSQFSNLLTAPKWIEAGSVITVSITDISGSSNTVNIVLKGERVYAKS